MEKERNLLEKVRDFLTISLAEETKEEPTKEVEELAEETKLMRRRLRDGANIEAEDWMPDRPVFIVPEEGDAIPLPAGEYEIDDGEILVVVEEGVISEIKPATEEEVVEEEEEMASVTRDEFNDLVNVVKGIAENLSKVELSKKKELELEKLNEDLQKQLDEIPDAAPTKQAPKEVDFSEMTPLEKYRYNKN